MLQRGIDLAHCQVAQGQRQGVALQRAGQQFFGVGEDELGHRPGLRGFAQRVVRGDQVDGRIADDLARPHLTGHAQCLLAHRPAVFMVEQVLVVAGQIAERGDQGPLQIGLLGRFMGGVEVAQGFVLVAQHLVGDGARVVRHKAVHRIAFEVVAAVDVGLQRGRAGVVAHAPQVDGLHFVAKGQA
jgi:hypothetical protein